MLSQTDPAKPDSVAGSAVEQKEERKPRPLIWTAMGIFLGAILLYSSTRKVNPSELLRILEGAELRWAIGVFLVNLVFIAIKAWRWALLLRFVPGLTFGRLHGAVYAGLAVNFLIAHVGEFLRAGMIARSSRASMSSVFASVLIERTLDFIALTILVMTASLIATNVPDFVEVAQLFVIAAAVVSISGLFLISHTPRWLDDLLGTWSRPVPFRIRHWARNQIEHLRFGLRSIANPKLMASTIVISVVQWSTTVMAIWMSGAAVGESVSLLAAIGTFVLIVIGLALPTAPMQLGTTQLAFTVGFAVGGISATSAIAASLIYTAFLIVPVMLFGGIYLLRQHFGAERPEIPSI